MTQVSDVAPGPLVSSSFNFLGPNRCVRPGVLASMAATPLRMTIAERVRAVEILVSGLSLRQQLLTLSQCPSRIQNFMMF